MVIAISARNGRPDPSDAAAADSAGPPAKRQKPNDGADAQPRGVSDAAAPAAALAQKPKKKGKEKKNNSVAALAWDAPVRRCLY